jgi:hypothetical protein
MSLWELRIVCDQGGRSWENVYHVETPGTDDISPAGVLALSNFYISRMYNVYRVVRTVRRLLGTPDSFIETVVDTVGALDPAGADLLPLFNTAKVLLQGGVGRPGVKFLRGMLIASDLTSSQDQLDPTKVSAIQGSWDTFQNAIEATTDQHLIFGAANKVAVSGIVDGTVQMRQRHRKRRRTI